MVTARGHAYQRRKKRWTRLAIRSTGWLFIALALFVFVSTSAAEPPSILPYHDTSYIALSGEDLTIRGAAHVDLGPVPVPCDGHTCLVYRYADIEVVGEPADATVTPSSCSPTLPRTCRSFQLQWRPTTGDVGVHVVRVIARSRPVTFLSGELVSIGEFDQTTEGTLRIAITDVTLASVEMTQAIQVGQSPQELQTYLDNNDGRPPVPLVAEKPWALRIIPGQVSVQTEVEVEVWSRLLEPENDEELELELRTVWPLSPRCTADMRRLRVNAPPATCRSIDFYQSAAADALLEGRGVFWVFLKYPHAATLPHLNSTNEQLERARALQHAPECQPTPDGFVNFACGLLNNPEYLNRFEANRFTVRAKKSDEIRLHAVNICTSLDNSQCLPTPVRSLKEHIRLLRTLAPTHAVQVLGAGPMARIHLGLAPDDDGDGADCYTHDGTKTLDGWRVGDTLFWVHFGFLGSVASCETYPWWDMALAKVAEAFARSGLPERSADSARNYFFGLAAAQPLHGPFSGYSYEPGTAGMSLLSSDQLYDEETVAHETGHMLGLGHTFGRGTRWFYPDEHIWSGTLNSTTGACDNCKLEVGLDVHRGSDRRAAKDGSSRFEFMSYDRLTWVSPVHYVEMLQVLDPPPADPSPEPGRFWLVSGFIDDQGTSLVPIFEFEAVARTDEGVGSHRIDVQDAAGTVLFRRAFTPRRGQARALTGAGLTGRPRFAEMLPVQAEATSIVIRDGAGVAVHSVALEGSAPDVTLAALPSGDLHGRVVVEWSVTDPDSDQHTFWVEYSADAGRHWSILAQALSQAALEVDFDAVPGSAGQALIRVLASDGIKTGSATAGPFSVRSKLPQTEIISPEPSDKLYAGEALVLEGLGYDVDDGVLRGAALQWTSDTYGWLGSGERITVGPVPPGQHVITLTGTDSDGNVAYATLAVNIGRPLTGEIPSTPAPVADAGGPYVGEEGATVAFDGTHSFDPDGGELSYGWDFGDGNAASGEQPTHAYTDDGAFQVHLTVSDREALRTTDQTVARIINRAPSLLLAPPAVGKAGSPLSLDASFSDPGVHDAPWQVTWRFGDGAADSFEVEAQGRVGRTHEYDAPGVYTAFLSVRDKDGAVTEAAVEVTVLDGSGGAGKGDINEDGRVTPLDALQAFRHFLGIQPLEEQQLVNADVNQDGQITPADTLCIFQRFLTRPSCLD